MSKRPQETSVFGPFSPETTDKLATQTGSDGSPPPSYNAEPAETAAFHNLTLSNLPVDPSLETCLAHLRLMFAFQWMKEDIGFTDGLWGLWDNGAGPVDPILKGRPVKEKGGQDIAEQEPSVEERIRDENLEKLSRVREKRWAVFVARAVDRYETWWKFLTKEMASRHLKEVDMNVPGSPQYDGFPTEVETVLQWTENMLPPLGKFFLPLNLSSANSPRCPYGVAYSHAEPSRVPGRCHAGGDAAVLGHRHALGSCQQGYRRRLQLYHLVRMQGSLDHADWPSLGQRRRPTCEEGEVSQVLSYDGHPLDHVPVCPGLRRRGAQPRRQRLRR